MPRVSVKPTKWFDCPNDPLKGRILVEHQTAGDLQEIARHTVDTKLIDQGHDGQGNRLVMSETRIDQGKSREMMAVAAVKNWENHLDAEGKVMECTAENKRIFSRDPEWMELLNQSLAVLAKEVAEKAEAERKNFSALPGGLPA